jgi:meiotically up-regulated gene 157 (Mug157) protein
VGLRVQHCSQVVFRENIADGIQKWGVKDHPDFGKVYAFEVDGLGGMNLMDDANVPSLLSLGYLDFRSPHDPDGVIVANTRNMVLSKANPFMIFGKYEGIGSPHTPRGSIWPMALITEVLTTRNTARVLHLFEVLQQTDAGTNMMHESFNANNPRSYTRSWFAWANSLFAEAIVAKVC